jgi:hypothetical protein
MEGVSLIWQEGSYREGWSVALSHRGQLLITLREGNKWAAHYGRLDVTLPIEIFDALVKHKGATRRHLAKLAAEKERD